MSAAERRLQIRNALLGSIAESADIGLPLDTLKRMVRESGFPLSEEALLAQLNYLREKGLLREAASQLSVARKRWHITAAGQEYCEEHDLI